MPGDTATMAVIQRKRSEDEEEHVLQWRVESVVNLWKNIIGNCTFQFNIENHQSVLWAKTLFFCSQKYANTGSLCAGGSTRFQRRRESEVRLLRTHTHTHGHVRQSRKSAIVTSLETANADLGSKNGGRTHRFPKDSGASGMSQLYFKSVTTVSCTKFKLTWPQASVSVCKWMNLEFDWTFRPVCSWEMFTHVCCDLILISPLQWSFV